MITKYMHKETGSVDDMDGWLSAYSAEELEERGFASAQAAFEHDTAAGMLVKQEFCDDLQELTRQESGIVLFDNGEAIACNWSGISGIPRLSPLGDTVMGMGERIPIVEPEHTENMAEMLEGARFIYANGEEMPTEGKVYRLDGLGLTVFAPYDWA